MTSLIYLSLKFLMILNCCCLLWKIDGWTEIIKLALSAAQSPSVWVFVLIVQRNDFHLLLSLADGVLVWDSKELRGNLHEPLGVDCTHFSHVLFRSHDEFVVDDSLRVLVKQTARRVDVNLVVVGHSSVSFMLVFLCWVDEEAGCDSFSQTFEVTLAWTNFKFVPFHDAYS